MNKKLSSLLINKYPLCFKELKNIECDDGWFNLLDYLCATLECYLTYSTRSKNYFTQIKEKFGILRVYVKEPGDKYIDGVLSFAEVISVNFCEVCGNHAKLRPGSWIRSLCNWHYFTSKIRSIKHKILFYFKYKWMT